MVGCWSWRPAFFQTDNGKWNESRIGVVAKVLREHDSRVSFNLFLKWCEKYGDSDDLMLPVLSKKKDDGRPI